MLKENFDRFKKKTELKQKKCKCLYKLKLYIGQTMATIIFAISLSLLSIYLPSLYLYGYIFTFVLFFLR